MTGYSLLSTSHSSEVNRLLAFNWTPLTRHTRGDPFRVVGRGSTRKRVLQVTLEEMHAFTAFLKTVFFERS